MSDRFPKASFAEVSQVPQSCMGMHIRRASRILTQLYNDALRPLGLVSSQFTLLVAIHLMGNPSVTDLADQLCADQTTLTRNLKVLEKKGLIGLEVGTDRRVRLVSLTDAGHETIVQALPLWKQVQADLADRVDLQKWQDLLAFLADLKTLDR